MFNQKNEIEINICVWDWKSYSGGDPIGWQWFTLPAEVGDLEDHLSELAELGHDEPFICDTDGWGDVIDEYTPINAVINVALDIERMGRAELLQEYFNHTAQVGGEIFERSNENLLLAVGSDPIRLMHAAHFGEYNPLKEYFYLNGYDNIVSVDESEKDAIEYGHIKELIADYIQEGVR